MSEENKTVSLSLSVQYPSDSLNGRRYKALKAYYGKDLRKLVEQAVWAVLGPLGSAAAGLPADAIEAQARASKSLIAALQYEALDMGGANPPAPAGGESLSELLPEPSVEDSGGVDIDDYF